MDIKTYKIFSNKDTKAITITENLRKELNNNDFIEQNINFDLGIAVGGDGSFLRMVKECNFNDNILYVGINAGTLGFLQVIKPNEIKKFVQKLKANNYYTQEIGIQKTTINYFNQEKTFTSLNEIVIRDKNLNTAFLNIDINNVRLESFVGDGLLISTSIGSTAYNLSLGGCIVYNEIHALQITPIAPLYNKVYKSLRNSTIIPENSAITITPFKDKRNLSLNIDGVINNFEDVSKITTKISDRKIKCFRLTDSNYTKIINNKFL